jgi:glycolate oxidase FAD binding subunit
MNEAIEHIQSQVREAARLHRTWRIVGGGTKDFLGEPLQGEALSTSGLNGILAYEPTELVITAGAGTPLAEIQSRLAEQRQYLPFDPPRWGEQSTLGGVVAAGLSGPARASVGGVRDFVLGAHMINGKAELLQFGGQVMKNVAGYDVSRLLAGSMGTLGVITQLSIKVLPEPLAERTLTWLGRQEDALAQLLRWRAKPLPMDASCWCATPDDAEHGVLSVRLRGAQVAIDVAIERMNADTMGGPLEWQHTDTGLDWDAVRDQAHEFFSRPPAPEACLWRLSVPAATPVMALGLPRLMEWHGAQRWFWASVQEAHGLRDWANSVGGHATLFRTSALNGDADKKVGAYSTQAPVLTQVNERIQAQFDPHGVFRTQRLG